MHKRIILCGPTAGGKNFIREKFREKGYDVNVSYTSRPLREGEIDGKDYHFISRNEFINKSVGIPSGLGFYEYAYHGDNFYGTGLREWDNNEIFIMETEGISQLSPDDRKNSLVIYINTSLETRILRMKDERKWSDEKIKERIEVDIEKF